MANEDSIFWIIVFVWVFSALSAGYIASSRGLSYWNYALTTLIFLGPLGPGFALIAQHGRIEKAQLRALEDADDEVDTSAPTLGILPPPVSDEVSKLEEITIAPEPAPIVVPKSIYCSNCGYVQDVPEGQTTFECGDCQQLLKVSPTKP